MSPSHPGLPNKILVISDIHGNREALQAVLDQEPVFDELVFLGDAVSPGPQPNETIQLLRTLPGVHICGNHDLEMLDPSLTEHWPAPWKAFNDWVYNNLSSIGFEYLKSLQPNGSYAIGGQDIYLCHGQLHQRPRHVLPNSSIKDFQALAPKDGSGLVLFGHSHVQIAKSIGNRRFFNPGSVGQNRCGKPVACYGVIEKGEFYHRQAKYDLSPLISALNKIEPLNEYPEFKDWFGEGLIRGYGLGRSEPWVTLAAQGYV